MPIQQMPDTELPLTRFKLLLLADEQREEGQRLTLRQVVDRFMEVKISSESDLKDMLSFVYEHRPDAYQQLEDLYLWK